MFHDLTGRRMSGANVLSRGSHHTPDLLAELGFLYHADWMHDDQPTPIKVRRGRLVSVPYSMELNDALFVMFQRPWEGEEFFQVAKDQFDRLYAEGADQGMVMCLVLHPWVIGYPQRIGALDRILELRPRSRGGLARNGGGDCAVLSRQPLRGDDEAPRARRGDRAMNAYRMDHGHYAWSPIVGRERLTWPNGARIAVAFVVSLGHFEADPPSGAFDPPTHRSPLRIMPPPDYPTVTHREYGHRVGIFRLFELFDAHAIPATAAVDVLTAQGYPQLVTECRRRGWEVIAHGVGQRRAITAEMSEADERALHPGCPRRRRQRRRCQAEGMAQPRAERVGADARLAGGGRRGLPLRLGKR